MCAVKLFQQQQLCISNTTNPKSLVWHATAIYCIMLTLMAKILSIYITLKIFKHKQLRLN